MGKRGEDAVGVMEEAIAAGDGQPTPALLSELALAQRVVGDRQAAKQSLEEALALDDRYATAYYILGNMAGSAQRYEQAAAYYDRYLKLEPQGPLAGRAQERLRIVRNLKARTRRADH